MTAGARDRRSFDRRRRHRSVVSPAHRGRRGIPARRAALDRWPVEGVTVGGGAGGGPGRLRLRRRRGGRRRRSRICASVGSSVTAMMSAIASAASAHDRATKRRGGCSAPGVRQDQLGDDVSRARRRERDSGRRWRRRRRTGCAASGRRPAPPDRSREMQSAAPRNSRRAFVDAARALARRRAVDPGSGGGAQPAGLRPRSSRGW